MEPAIADYKYLLSPLTFIFCIATILSFKVASPYLSQKFVHFYPSLPGSKKDYWNSLPVSFVHAPLVTLFCILAVIFDQDGSVENQVLMKSKIGTAALQMSFGFFVGDFYVIFSSNMSERREFIFHHISSLISMAIGLLFGGRWMMLALVRLTSEMSTPFVNFRWILQESNTPKTTKKYLFCGIGMTVTFYVSRVFVIPFHWYFFARMMFYEHSLDPERMFPFPLQIWTIFACLVFDCLNIYWAYKIAKGLISFLRVYFNKKL